MHHGGPLVGEVWRLGHYGGGTLVVVLAVDAELRQVAGGDGGPAWVKVEELGPGVRGGPVECVACVERRPASDLLYGFPVCAHHRDHVEDCQPGRPCSCAVEVGR